MAIQCSTCGPGTYSTGVNSSCVPCPENTFQNSSGATSCYPCKPGTSQPFSGASFCSYCQPGYYQNGSVVGCLPCDIGSFSNQGAATTCHPCPAGTYAVLCICRAVVCVTCHVPLTPPRTRRVPRPVPQLCEVTSSPQRAATSSSSARPVRSPMPAGCPRASSVPPARSASRARKYASTATAGRTSPEVVAWRVCLAR
jgi:hypothetical protein